MIKSHLKHKFQMAQNKKKNEIHLHYNEYFKVTPYVLWSPSTAA